MQPDPETDDSARADDEQVLRLPDEWAQLDGQKIVDPDGWRGADGKPMDVPISREEYETRSARSTTEPLGDDLPAETAETAETPTSDAESASGAEDAAETAGNADAEEEEIMLTAPVFEVETVISSSGVYVQRIPGGGRQVKIVPVRMTRQGPMPMLPAYVLNFPTPEAWDAFRSAIENDGQPKSKIVTASHLPPTPGSM